MSDDQDRERGNTSGEIVPVNPVRGAIRGPDGAWIEATQGLQDTLIGTLRNYQASFLDRATISRQRREMLRQVTEHYVNYLREEAALTTQSALDARGSVLRQELNRLKARLYTELADITGVTVRQIEQIMQTHVSQMKTPAIQRAYTEFVMTKIFDLMEMHYNSKSSE